jgi:hypothetical protein
VTLDRSLGRFLNSIRAEPFSPLPLRYPKPEGPPTCLSVQSQWEMDWFTGMRSIHYACLDHNGDRVDWIECLFPER